MLVRVVLAAVALVLALGASPATMSASAAEDPLRGLQWALDAIHLGDLLGTSKSKPPPVGQGVIVAVVDSGVDRAHPDLAGRVLSGPDLIEDDANPDDAQGHGTHVAGIIAAIAHNGIGGAGVAPAAQVLAVRVLNDRNIGSARGVARGINAAIDAGADVINLSLNWSEPNEDLSLVTAAMQRAADAGIVVIVAAGNDAKSHCEEPVLERVALCVGALDSGLQLAPFSSHGQGLGLVAPGSQVLSTYPGERYARMSGTSQAAAQASGVAALLVGLGLRGDKVLQRLTDSARDIGVRGYDALTGYGLLDAGRAVDGAAEGRIPPYLRIGAAQRSAQRSVRQNGLRVRCDAARAGLCRVRVRVRGAVVASGSLNVNGAEAVTVRTKPTRAARRILNGKRELKGLIEVALTGSPGVRQPLVLRRR